MHEMLACVRTSIKERDAIATKLETRFPFRRLADHCYLTYPWAQHIHVNEGGEREIIEIAATITYDRVCAAYARLKDGQRNLETETGQRFYRERIEFLGQIQEQPGI